MFRLHRLETLPDNFPEFVGEIASGIGGLYGPRAAETYHQTARKRVQATIAHPAVDAIAVGEDAAQGVAGFLLSVMRGTVGQIAFIHVLQRYAGQGVEQRLIEEAVRTLRAGGAEGIVSECITFCPLDLEGTYESLGFRRIERVLMAAPLDTPGLAPPPLAESFACDQAATPDLAAIIVKTYRDHPGRDIHPEVRSRESAGQYVASVLQGGFGRVRSGYVRAIRRERGPIAMVAGCEVAPGVGFVLQVAVIPAYQRKGLGTQLLQELATRLRQAGLRQLALGVTRSNPALQLYERLGFKPLRSIDVHVWWHPNHAQKKPARSTKRSDT
jgi:ribosomal protein S18 acetylase RimI-like enzyme